MRIITARKALVGPPEAHILLRARIERKRGRTGPEPPEFVIDIQGDDGDWITTRLHEGERIDFTIYLP